jgi:hypothetical protein
VKIASVRLVVGILLVAACDRFLQLEPVHVYRDGAPEAADAPIDVPIDAVPSMVVQAISNGNPSTTSVSVTLQAMPATNHMLLAIGGSSNGGIITLTGAAGWQSVSSTEYSATEFFWIGAPNGTGKTVTLTTNKMAPMWLEVIEWTGIDQLSPLDGSIGHGSGSGTTSTGPIDLSVVTPGGPDLIVFGVAFYDTVPTPMGTWFSLPNAMTNGPVTQHSWYQIAWAAGTVEAKTTYKDDYDAVLAAFRTAP